MAGQPDYFEEEILVFENADSISFPESAKLYLQFKCAFLDSLIEGMRPHDYSTASEVRNGACFTTWTESSCSMHQEQLSSLWA